jgi:predicted N-acetyltransferase YhbS
MITIRPETKHDVAAREALLDQAFGASRFVKTAQRLRDDRLPAEHLSFVACEDGRLVGTVRLWDVTAGPGRPALLLGPLAVAQPYRGAGLGARLIRHALAAAAARGDGAVLLVGDTSYYERFGFSAEKTGGLWLPGPYERHRLLGCELKPGGLDGAHGLVTPAGRPIPQPDLAASATRLVVHDRASLRRAARAR